MSKYKQSSRAINEQRPDIRKISDIFSQEFSKTRPDLQYERPSSKVRQKMHRNRHYLNKDLERLHQCKQCKNTFINVKGYCFAHWCAKNQKIGALYNQIREDLDE